DTRSVGVRSALPRARPPRSCVAPSRPAGTGPRRPRSPASRHEASPAQSPAETRVQPGLARGYGRALRRGPENRAYPPSPASQSFGTPCHTGPRCVARSILTGTMTGMADMDDPKTVLHHYLRSSRDDLIWKLDGLGERDARLPRTPTGNNLLGIVKHC